MAQKKTKRSRRVKRTKRVSDAALFASLRDAYADDEKYRIVQTLVKVAGHLTIRDLFSLTRFDVDEEIVRAIQDARAAGMRMVPNNKCCKRGGGDPDDCASNPDTTCQLIRGGPGDGRKVCTLVSDICPGY